MKKIIILFYAVLIMGESISQTSIAEFDVIKSYIHTGENGISSVVGKVNFKAYVYIRDSTAISFEKPSFIKEYPEGNIAFQISESNFGLIELPIDSIQNINKINFDSSEFYSPHSEQILKWKFEPGYQVWEYTNETKTINGFTCQKAIRKTNETVYQIVWFAPDIQVKANIMNIQNLPGLAVEVEAPTINTIYKLTSFIQNVEIPDSVFNLKEFEGKKTKFVSYLRKPK